MGALGFEPRSAGFYLGSSLQLVFTISVNPMTIIPHITGAREDAVLPHAPLI